MKKFLPLFIFLALALSAFAQQEPNQNNIIGNQEQKENPASPKYVPGEILVKFSEGVNPEETLSNAGLASSSVERVHSIQPAIAGFKKETKIEKNSEGWFWFLGKQYKDVGQIPDEKIFQAALDKMPEEEKALYRTYKVKLPPETKVEDAVAELKGKPCIEFAEPNYIVEAFMKSNDPYFNSANSWRQGYDDLWGLKKLDCEKAWDKSQGQGVIVAVIDTGIDYTHPDLKDNMWVNPREIPGNGIDDDGNGYIDDVYGYDFSKNASDPMDRYGHGTHCAGTIAAVPNNNLGVIGIAPAAKLMAVKGLGDNGSGDDAVLAKAVKYAADNGARVLSNSWGGVGDSTALSDVFKYAYSKGCVVIAAAGNSSMDMGNFCPANIPEVIAVSALTQKDEKCAFSNFGAKIEVGAPGGGYSSDTYNILSTMPDNSVLAATLPSLKVANGYWRLAGTSMACPHVSGVAALILGLHPEFSNEEARQVLRASTDDILGAGYDAYSGWGRVNAAKALDIDTPCIARVDKVEFDEADNALDITGTAKGNDFKSYTLALTNLDTQKQVFKQAFQNQTDNSNLGRISLEGLPDGAYSVSVEIKSAKGVVFRDQKGYTVDNMVITSPKNYFPFSSDIVIRGQSRYAYKISWGEGENPANWSDAGVALSKDSDILGTIAIASLPKKDGIITIKVSDEAGNAETVLIYNCFTTKIRSNWPKDFSDSYSVFFSVADLNHDGQKEIIALKSYISSFSLCVFKADGTLLAESAKLFGTVSQRPAITENAGKAQIVVYAAYRTGTGEYKGHVFVFSFSNAGLTMNTYFETVPFASGCVLADLNNDGQKEIIVSGFTQTAVHRMSGQMLPGWPQKTAPSYAGLSITSNANFLPAVADVDNDGTLEIVAMGLETTSGNYSVTTPNITRVYINCFKPDGKVLSGWPKLLSETSGPNSFYVDFAPPVIGDVNNDGYKEIIAPSQNGVFVLDRFANTLWKDLYISDTRAQKSLITNLLLTDVDNDSVPEISASAYAMNNIAGTTMAYISLKNSIFRGNGQLLSSLGLPVNTKILSGDMDKDGSQDLFLARNNIGTGFDFFNPRNSQSFYNFDIKNVVPIEGMILADLASDGVTEIISACRSVFTNSAYLFVWEVNNPSTREFNSDWPMLGHDAEFSGTYSSSSVVKPPPPPPPPPKENPPLAPTSLSASALSEKEIMLNWKDNSDNETGFKIERSLTNATGFTQVAALAAGTAAYKDTNLLASTTYYYRVKAYNAIGDSDYSQVAQAKTLDVIVTPPPPPPPPPPEPIVPKAPSELSATINGNDQVVLIWKNNTDNLNGTKIERSIGNDKNFKFIAVSMLNRTTYLDWQITPDILYYYRVRAFNANGDSDYSQTISIKTPPAEIKPGNTPAAPTNLKLSAAFLPGGKVLKVDLNWKDNADNEIGFIIQLSMDGQSNFQDMTRVGENVTGYSFQLDKPGLYYYRVKAYNTNGESAATQGTGLKLM